MMKILTIVRVYIFKVFNIILGKTKIFIVILGWFFVITGLFMLFWPERARRKLIGIGFSQAKGVILLVSIYLLSLLLSLGGKIGAILTLAGVIALAFTYLLLKKKAYNKIKEWLTNVPVKLLKIFSYVQIVVGVLMLTILNRVW
jgi:uncharacterized protein YjeT (DUF2065 family)